MAVMGDPKSALGVQVLSALGLPTTKCIGLEVRFMPNDIVTAVATYAPDAECADKLVRVLQAAQVA